MSLPSLVTPGRKHCLSTWVVVISVGVWACLGAVETSAGTESGSVPELNEIRQTYYRQDKEKGIRLLLDALAAGKCYTASSLEDTVLVMISDYFERADDPDSFARLMYYIAKCGGSEVVENELLGTSLYEQALAGIAVYETPMRIDVSMDQREAEIGSEVDFRLGVFNAKGDRLSIKDVELECRVEPVECGTCDISRKVFAATKGGIATLKVFAVDYPEVTQAATVTIPIPRAALAPPEPRIERIVPDSGPVGSSIRLFGENFHEMPDSNRVVFIGASAVAERVITDPAGFDELGVIVPEGVISGPVLVRTPAGEAKSPADFTVVVLPEKLPPSKKWAWISTGATALAGVGFVYFNSEAKEASDSGDQSRWDEVSPYETGFGVATLAGVGVSSYLWYRYFKQKGDYDRSRETADYQVNMEWDKGHPRIMLTRRF